MTPQDAVTISQEAVKITLILAGPVLLVGMAVGLFISLFQAVTQIQEMTLTFVPKIVAVMLTVLFLASWMIAKMVDYTHNLITSLPVLIR
ncbi:MAG: flagellar biosynthesis protein FliQ [Thermodesulfobacteriota bacterium]|jgi:flagellar biosynthetic protein FliQ